MASKKQTKRILDWIEAYSRLVQLDIRYFELSINTTNKYLKKKYRKISDAYHQGVENLVEKKP